MFRRTVIPSALIACVSVPAFLLGEKLRQGDPAVPTLTLCLTAVVLLASAIMRQPD